MFYCFSQGVLDQRVETNKVYNFIVINMHNILVWRLEAVICYPKMIPIP